MLDKKRQARHIAYFNHLALGSPSLHLRHPSSLCLTRIFRIHTPIAISTPRPPYIENLFYNARKSPLPGWVFYFSFDVPAPWELCAHFIFFLANTSYFLADLPSHATPPFHRPSLMYLISQSARWKFDFDCSSRTKDVRLPCAIQFKHTSSIHTSDVTDTPPPPTLLGLCPAGDAQCHMCSVWRHKWRQIALTLILIPIPNRIRIRILAHHILSFNYHRRIIAFAHGSWWFKESPDIGDEVYPFLYIILLIFNTNALNCYLI